MTAKKIWKEFQRHLSPAQAERVHRLYYWFAGLPSPMIAWWYRRKNTGAETHIDRTAQFLGWKSIRIGKRSLISEGCWLNVNQRGNDRTAILIGDDCFIGRRNFFSSGHLIHIGAYGLVGADCHFLGSDHVFSDPFRPYIATGTTSSNTIYIGANCWIGARATFVGNVRVGHGCIIGAGALVNKDIPPFSIAVGTPARVIKRFNSLKSEWVSVADFTGEMEDALPDEDNYLATLRSNAPMIRMPIPAAGRCQGDLP